MISASSAVVSNAKGEGLPNHSITFWPSGIVVEIHVRRGARRMLPDRISQTALTTVNPTSKGRVAIMHLKECVVMVGILAVAAANARAEEDTTIAHDAATLAVEDGTYVAGVVAPRRQSQGVVVLIGGWDSARSHPTFDGVVEVRLFKSIFLRGRVARSGQGTFAPGAGAGIQMLDERKHGVSSTLLIMFKAEGFTEPEGEIEATLAVGKTIGPTRFAMNAVYGQDPEGRERDAEAAIAVDRLVTRRVALGLDAAYHDALGTQRTGGVSRDFTATGFAMVLVARNYALIGHIGGTVVDLGTMESGVVASVGVGAAF